MNMKLSPIPVQEPSLVIDRTNDPEGAWRRCCVRLRAELGEDIFNSWFGRLEIESVTNNVAKFTVATRFLKSWIESHYRDRILTALRGEMGTVYGLSIAVRSSTRTASSVPPRLMPSV